MGFLSNFSVLNVVLNAIGFILKEKAVTIYNSSNQEVLENSSIIDCSIQHKARLMEHPLETGAKIVDHKVFEPKIISLQVALPNVYYEDQYREILQLYEDCEALTVQTKLDIYPNLQITGLPHEESSDSVNRIFFNLELREAQVVNSVFISTGGGVKNRENSKTVNTGQAQAKSSSVLYNWFYK